MSQTEFYRSQAAEQQLAADAATLHNVRDRCVRASSAWAALASRSERTDASRIKAAADKLFEGLSENPDRGFATV